MDKEFAILGMSEDSTRWYQKQLSPNDVQQVVKTHVYPTNFEEMNALLPRPSEELKQILKSYLQAITGVDFVLVPNITIHETLDEILAAQPYEFALIHPIQLTIEKLKENDVSEVVLVGSMYTMQEGFISKQLSNYGIQSFFPKHTDKIEIDNIRKAVYQRNVTKKLLEDFNKLIED